jgi:hypothetical protein
MALSELVVIRVGMQIKAETIVLNAFFSNTIKNIVVYLKNTFYL